MNKKKTRKSKVAKSMRDLPEKTVNAKTAKGVKGGVTFEYGALGVVYTQQKPTGTVKP